MTQQIDYQVINFKLIDKSLVKANPSMMHSVYHL